MWKHVSRDRDNQSGKDRIERECDDPIIKKNLFTNNNKEIPERKNVPRTLLIEKESRKRYCVMMDAREYPEQKAV